MYFYHSNIRTDHRPQQAAPSVTLTIFIREHNEQVKILSLCKTEPHQMPSPPHDSRSIQKLTFKRVSGKQSERKDSATI
ncbi:hypothetical protein J6590_008274 [Homalodisca vitripennis]|nr:hypothetical protein J6590_008274 [Homalodisca vitripennis]